MEDKLKEIILDRFRSGETHAKHPDQNPDHIESVDRTSVYDSVLLRVQFPKH